MASGTSTISLERGSYRRSTKNDSRSPCPVINALANHGYIPRDGRKVHQQDLATAVNELGMDTFAVKALFTQPIFLEYEGTTPPRSWLESIYYHIWNPWAIVASKVGMRPAGQLDEDGQQYLNLDQMAAHDAIEHDVSLSRLDYGQGDNLHPQPHLIEELLAASSDGGKNLSMKDLALHRIHRFETQKRENKDLHYTALSHELGCGEVALLLKMFGDGEKVRCDYIKALFEDERLPYDEGWKAKPIGLMDIKGTNNKVQHMIGPVPV